MWFIKNHLCTIYDTKHLTPRKVSCAFCYTILKYFQLAEKLRKKVNDCFCRHLPIYSLKIQIFCVGIFVNFYYNVTYASKFWFESFLQPWKKYTGIAQWVEQLGCGQGNRCAIYGSVISFRLCIHPDFGFVQLSMRCVRWRLLSAVWTWHVLPRLTFRHHASSI